MREIKFRIAEFDEDEKFVGLLYLDATKEKFDSCWLRWDDPLITIQQYTGLKDKNGKEIYEGDVIRCDDANEGHEEFVTEVWFGQGQFLTRHYGFPVHSWSGKEKCWCEIIGNIYENSELITRPEQG